MVVAIDNFNALMGEQGAVAKLAGVLGPIPADLEEIRQLESEFGLATSPLDLITSSRHHRSAGLREAEAAVDALLRTRQLSAVPFVVAGTFPTLDAALFESVSGFTGTGSTPEKIRHEQRAQRSTSQPKAEF